MSFLILVCFVILFDSPIEKAVDKNVGDITVEIVNIKKHKGSIIACLSRTDRTFMKSCFLDIESASIESDTMLVTFRQVPFGKVAISLFQDQNDNGKLDVNLLKIPKEPFGFSKNPRLFMGPPSFNKCAFHLEVAHLQHTIVLKRI